MAKIKSISALERQALGCVQRLTGVRLRHQPKGLPFKPDYANKSKKVAVFLHGCFWHGCKSHWRRPKTNTRFWVDKVARNAKRHKEAVAGLKAAGWTVKTIWEHKVREMMK